MANYTITHKTEPPVHRDQCPNSEELSKRSSFFVASLVFVLSVNMFLIFAAVVGNLLIVWVLRGVTSIHPSSRALFYSLATSDLCVGFIVQPFNVLYMISTLTGNAALCSSTLPYFDVLGFAMCGISLLTASEISIDRLLALRLKFRYRQVVSFSRAFCVVVVTWLASFTAGLTSLWNRSAFTVIQIVGVFLSIAVSSFSYAWIHIILSQRGKQRQERQLAWDEPMQSVSRESSGFCSVRYKKTVATAQWVYCALLLCSLPYMIVAALWAVYSGSGVILICHAFAITLLYFNSALNPVLYCWKIREVRNEVKAIFNRVGCNW